MAQNHLKRLSLAAYGTAEMQWVIIGFESQKPEYRLKAIKSVAKLHGINLINAKSVTYNSALRRYAGKTVAGHVCIGPKAFEHDRPWLAYVILHEAVHADQFAFYDKKGIRFQHKQVRTEGERKLIAVDEFEAHYIPWANHKKLDLSRNQVARVKRGLVYSCIDIDDQRLQALARRGKVGQARQLVLEGL